MSPPRTTRRAVAEINFGEGQAIRFTAGNRSIHQLWHLFSAQFRHVLLAPQRRPDSGRVAWTWRESVENRPVTATELAEVRRRLAEASRSLAGGFGGLGSDDESPGSGGALEKQVHAAVGEMVEELVAHRDLVFTKFICRTDAGLMVHSWGGAVAAEPHYPDTQHGEISGGVIARNERLPGVNVTLENPQGGLVARVKSEADGSFRFPNVAAGNYRVRVTDRSDFPPEGLSVTMERESITGLELRSTATDPAAPFEASSTSLKEHLPWYRRRLVLVLCLLVVAGLGSCVWQSMRPTAAESGPTTKHSTGWQSASGQLAGGVNTNEPVDSRKVGADGAWTSLKSSTPLPAGATSRQPRSPTAGAGAGDRSALSPDDTAPTDLRAKEEKPANLDSKEKTSAAAAKSALTKPSDRNATASARSGEGELPADSQAENESGEEKAKPADSKLAKTPVGALGKKPSAALSPGAPPTEEVSAETALSAGGETATDPANPSQTGGSSAGKKSSATKNAVAASAGTVAAPAAGEESEAAAQEPAASTAQANDTGQLKATPGQNKKEKTDGLVDNTTAAASDSAAVAAQSGDAPVDPPESNPAAGKTTPTTPNSKKAAAKQPSSPAEPGAEPAPENPGDSTAASSKNPADKKTTLPPPVKTGTGAVAAKAAGDSTAEASSATETASANESAPAGAGNSSSKAGAKAPAKKSAAPTANSGANNEQTGESPIMAATRESERAGSRDRDIAAAPLVQAARVRATPWKARLVQDLILPTRPVTAAEEEALDDMRRKLLADRASQMPASFRQPRVTGGFSVEYPSAKNPPRWLDDSGAEIARATARVDRAELSLPETASLRGRNYVLSYPGGSELARVTIDQAGVPVLKLAPGVRAWYSVEIEGLPAAGGFDWRLLSGAALPASWVRTWQRLEIPLDATTTRVGNYGVALVDAKSGWALASDIALQ